MLTVEIPIPDQKKPPVLKFPDRCAHCGKPKQIVRPLKLDTGIRKRNGAVMVELPVPLCAECEGKERRITNITLLPFFMAGLLICVIVFVPVWLMTPDGTTSQTLGFSLTVGTFVGLIAGIVGGSIVEFVLKLMFAPVYGQLLLKRPLTAVSLFNDSEAVIGLAAKFTDKKRSLKLTFENDDIAREFEKLNPLEKK